MATKKGGRSGCNGRDSRGKRLGVKCYAGEQIPAGSIIIRQRGTRFMAGLNVKQARDNSLFALKTGIVRFEKNSKRIYIDTSPSAK